MSPGAGSLPERFLEAMGDDGQHADGAAGGFAERRIGFLVEVEAVEEGGGRRAEAIQAGLADALRVARLGLEDHADGVVDELPSARREPDVLSAFSGAARDALGVARLFGDPEQLGAALSTHRELSSELRERARFSPDEGEEGTEVGTELLVAPFAREAGDHPSIEVLCDPEQMADPVVAVALDLREGRFGRGRLQGGRAGHEARISTVST